MRLFLVLAAAFLSTLFIHPVPAGASDGKFTLELNNARDAEGGCRVSFIAVNGTGIVLDKTAYEVVVFDAEGLVSQFLILEFGHLPANKTKVVQFDLAELSCASISRLLINDAAECVSNEAPSTVCLDALSTTARTEIGFGI
ncbi:MAG: hypothetical protein AAGL24_09345 [Pseudomonadota bacterium]